MFQSIHSGSHTETAIRAIDPMTFPVILRTQKKSGSFIVPA
jgi:hypothetical protein